MRRSLVLATRGSDLALAQSNAVAAQIRALVPDIDVTLERIRTRGDKIRDVPLAQVGGKGLFTKEIEVALLEGRADCAVHSLKDLPTELPAGLCIAAMPARAPAQDVLITRDGIGLDALHAGARVGTSSLRRRLQLAAARPDLALVDLRGNVPTRIEHVLAGRIDAAVLAAAGLARLGLHDVRHTPMPPEVMLSAAGQGALAIEAREDDAELLALLRQLDDPATRAAVETERAVLQGLGGGCQSPLGIHAREVAGHWQLDAVWLARPQAPARVALRGNHGAGPEALAVQAVRALRGIEGGGEAALRGRRLLVTRAAGHAEDLAAQLAAHGAEPVVLPLIATEACTPREALPEAGAIDGLLFTSPNGARGFAAACQARGTPVRDYVACSVCAVGPATAEAAAAIGLPVSLVPERNHAEALADALRLLHADLAQTRWLWPRGNRARPHLAETLRAAGAVVDDPVVYRTAQRTPGAAEIAAALDPAPDACLFTSASTVRALDAVLAPERRTALYAGLALVIGPQTAEAARSAGWQRVEVSETHTIPGLLALTLAHFS